MMERANSISSRGPRLATGGRLRSRTLVVAGLLLVLTVAVVAAVEQPWASHGDRQDVGPYRYRFARPERGSVRRALEAEIAFLQARINLDPDGGLDLAALAASYLKMARATGHLQWYLLAEQTARRSLANLPYQNHAALLALARVAEARHDFAEALRLAGLAGSGPEALSIMVTSNLALGRVEEAARAAEALTRAAPGLGSYALRALVAEAKGEDAAVLADLRRAIAAEEPGEAGSSAWARTLLGRFLARRGRLHAAEALHREALRILPQYPLALIELAEVETRTGRYADAERHYWQVLATSPGAPSPAVFDHVAIQGLARVAALRGDRSAADVLWAKAEAMIRGHLDAFGHRRELARLLLERGRPADVAEALRLARADAAARRDPLTLETLAWALVRAGRPAQARRVIDEALQSGRRDASLFYRAGTIEQALGNSMQARWRFWQARQVDPAFDQRTPLALGLMSHAR